ncbi:MAG TPA: hypothetical protein PKJ98_19585 [Verrucomicrobiota bacterium]|nr:hypothetical protein [Verrucomicrobiota bacterium]
MLAFACVLFFNLFHAHEHCIKQTGAAFRSYATEHDGKFPADTNGFGNALLLLVKGGYLGDTNGHYGVGPITGPGDDGEVFREALRTGLRIPEEKCSRVYIQGLSKANNPRLVILFDKRPTPGSDHFHRPWGPLLREVCFLDGSMQCIQESSWPAFASNQVELLVQEGFERAQATHYFHIP